MSEENTQALENTETEFEFAPSHEAVEKIASAIMEVLSSEELGDPRGLDVLVALECLAAYIREQYGIVKMDANPKEDENDSEV